MNDKVICPRYPRKIRASKRNRESLAIRIQKLKKKYRMNYRIYACEYCNGLHITRHSKNEYDQKLNSYV